MIAYIVDGNWILHRILYTIKTSPENMGKKLSSAFLALVMKDALAVRATHVLVAFDGPEVFRYKVYKGYKESRAEKQKDPERDHLSTINKYEHLGLIQALLTQAGVLWVQPQKHEADDVLASVADQYSSELNIVLGSSDKDDYQVLSESVTMYDSAFKPEPRYITQESAELRKGCLVSQMIDYQTLLGDLGDSIPGFPGFGPKKIENLLKTYGSIKAWYAKGSKEDKQWLIKNQVALKRNRTLVSLVRDLPLPTVAEMIIKKVPVKETYPQTWHDYYNFIHSKRRKLF